MTRSGHRRYRLPAAAIPAALALACVAAAAPAPHGAGRAARAAHRAGPAVTGTSVPGAPNCPLFPADNVWNTDISKLPVTPRSAAWLGSMNASATKLHPDFGPNPGAFPYGIPFNIYTSAHPLVRIHFTYASESDPGPYPFGAGTPIEGGRHASGDRHAIMVNKATCTLYELYGAHYSAHPTAGSGAIWRLRSNALRPAGWTSADAAGLPILPGLLNYAQVAAAVKAGRPITHAIRFTAQHTRSAYIWPARHKAGSGPAASLPPMGARFRLKAGFNVAGFCSDSAPYCKDAKAVLVEMQHYGLILADNGSKLVLPGQRLPAVAGCADLAAEADSRQRLRGGG
jgi:hypothetical protein